MWFKKEFAVDMLNKIARDEIKQPKGSFTLIISKLTKEEEPYKRQISLAISAVKSDCGHPDGTIVFDGDTTDTSTLLDKGHIFEVPVAYIHIGKAGGCKRNIDAPTIAINKS